MIHLYFLVCKRTCTHEDSQFSPPVVLIIFNTCVLDFCVVPVVRLDRVYVFFFFYLFMVFNLWISPGFSFESCS